MVVVGHTPYENVAIAARTRSQHRVRFNMKHDDDRARL